MSFMNSSSLASSFAMSEVKTCLGNIEKRWESICSAIFSFFSSEILGIGGGSYSVLNVFGLFWVYK